MAVYALGLTPLLEIMVNIISDSYEEMVAFADDLAAVGRVEHLRKWWDTLTSIGPLFGYHPQP